MASTARHSLQDRSTYLPLEAQALRRCIAGLSEECFSLSEKARQESQPKDSEASEGSDIWEMIGLYPDDIRGYAYYAELRVPIAYPPGAADFLRRSGLFELPGVIDWFSQESQDRPKMRHYLETVDYLRLQVLDYIQRFDQLTIDQKAF